MREYFEYQTKNYKLLVDKLGGYDQVLDLYTNDEVFTLYDNRRLKVEVCYI